MKDDDFNVPGTDNCYGWKRIDDGKLWWCTTHKRQCTHVNDYGEPRCNPNLGGITMRCFPKQIVKLNMGDFEKIV